MFRLTGDAVYARCYLATLEWIAAEQVDWEYGEWHLLPPARGTPLADKAGPWKEPYHTGRAILRCLELSEGARESHQSGVAGS
jgi:mannose/cellobiose epimerase-like protein (N-acyl-D-glucosamine 2-epimerase family)